MLVGCGGHVEETAVELVKSEQVPSDLACFITGNNIF